MPRFTTSANCTGTLSAAQKTPETARPRSETQPEWGKRGRPPPAMRGPEAATPRITRYSATASKGPLSARFAALRVRVADGPRNADSTRLPGREVWLIGEWRDSGERKYYLSNLPPRTSLRRLAATVKARWSCERSEEHTSELQSHVNLVCRLLLEK